MWLSGPDIQNGICRDCFFLKQGGAWGNAANLLI